MSNFVAFFVSLSLFSAPLAFAQSPSQEERQQPANEETFRELLRVAGLDAYRYVKSANQKCVKYAIDNKSLFVITPAIASSLAGSYLGMRDELRASQKFVDSIVKSDMHSTNKVYELGKAGKTTEQAIRFPHGRAARFFSKTGAVLFIAWGIEQAYYFTTGNDMMSSASVHELVQWIRSKVSTPMNDQQLAEYYTTHEGFQQFLRLNNEEQVKKLMDENPVLVAGTIAISELVKAAGCRAVDFVAPNQLDEDSKKMLTQPSKVKGDQL